MVPSALRTLSVVTLLSAVSGTVMLLNTHHGHGGSTAVTAEASLTEDSAIPAAQAALTSSLVPAPRAAAVDRLPQRTVAAVRIKNARVAALAEAAATAKAAAERRRQEIRARASRSAGRDPKALARILLADRGWGAGQFSCLDSLWNRESRWNLHASNPSSGAYGIPQALPGSKMASAGSDWRNNPATQIKWGLNYIADRYGTPCGAWGHSQATGWY